MSRLFAAAFVTQWGLLPAAQRHLDRTALIAVVPAAAEALYRQVSPQGEARIMGFLASTFNRLVKSATSGKVTTDLTPAELDALANALAARTTRTVSPGAAYVSPAAFVSGLPPAPVMPAPAAPPAEVAPPAKPSSNIWPSDSPTGPDGQPKVVK